jgi:hypothetical protein
MQWLLLVIATILLCLPLLGYSLKVLRGDKPAPEVKEWGTLFIDGIKYAIIEIIYAIPVIIVAVIAVAPVLMAAFSGNPTAMLAGIGATLIGLVVLVIVAVIVCMFEFIGVVRFARTGSMGEAFNFSAILATIGKLGWISYLIAIIIVVVLIGIVAGILSAIPFIGSLLVFLLVPFIALFQARYLCQVYDSAGTA